MIACFILTACADRCESEGCVKCEISGTVPSHIIETIKSENRCQPYDGLKNFLYKNESGRYGEIHVVTLRCNDKANTTIRQIYRR